MTIIHVSGSSASGKTYLGNIMKKIYTPEKLHIVDLDNIFSESMHKTNKKFLDIKKYVTSFINAQAKKYKNLLLIGYSDILVNGVLHYIDLHADYKYFIDIDTTMLIKQYRQRAAQCILQTRNCINAMSDIDIKKMVTTDNTVYENYERLPQLQIIKKIILQIGS